MASSFGSVTAPFIDPVAFCANAENATAINKKKTLALNPMKRAWPDRRIVAIDLEWCALDTLAENLMVLVLHMNSRSLVICPEFTLLTIVATVFGSEVE
jgi:hypothetical protein